MKRLLLIVMLLFAVPVRAQQLNPPFGGGGNGIPVNLYNVNINGVLTATTFPGADIGQQVNNAVASLPLETSSGYGYRWGTVYIPAGAAGGATTYNFSTTMQLSPFTNLRCDPSIILNYTGPPNTDAINQQDPNPDNTPSIYGGVENCQIHLNSTGQVAIHTGDTDGERYLHNVLWSATYPGLANTIGFLVESRVYFQEHSTYSQNLLQNVNNGFVFKKNCEPDVTFTGSITGNTLTVTSGSGLYTGGQIIGTGVAANTLLSAFGTGTGGIGTYNVMPAQTLASGSYTETVVNGSGNCAADVMYNFITGNYCQIGIVGGNCLEVIGGTQMLGNNVQLTANMNGVGSAVIYADGPSKYYNNNDQIESESTAGGGFCTNQAASHTDGLGVTLNGVPGCFMGNAIGGVAAVTAMAGPIQYQKFTAHGTYTYFFGSGYVDVMLWGAGGGGYNGATGGYGGGSGGFAHCIINGPPNSVGTITIGQGGAPGNPGGTGGDTSVVYGAASCTAHGGAGGSLAAGGAGGTTSNSMTPLFQMTGPASVGGYGGSGTPGYCPCGGNAASLGSNAGGDGMVWFMAR